MNSMRRDVMAGGLCAVLGCEAWPAFGKMTRRDNEGETPAGERFILYPIGKVEKAKGRTELRLGAHYAPALLGLDGFSHIHVLWWFDENDSPEKRRILQVHPRGNKANPLTGVFATRAPVRPNLIATTLCKIVRVRDNVIDVEDIDAFDGTPILDLKPYIPASDCAEDGVRTPDWLRGDSGRD